MLIIYKGIILAIAQSQRSVVRRRNGVSDRHMQSNN
jgi:hypothetical protein